jgi:hypothetical protein
MGDLLLDGRTIDNRPTQFEKSIRLANVTLPAYEKELPFFQSLGGSEITVSFGGEIPTYLTSGMNELSGLQTEAIQGQEIPFDFTPFVAGDGVIQRAEMPQQPTESEYQIDIGVNTLSTGASQYGSHATPSTGNTFEWGSFDVGFDPDSVRERYERRTPTATAISGTAKTVDRGGLITEVSLSGRIDGQGQYDFWELAKSNNFARLDAPFQSGDAVLKQLRIRNDQGAPDEITGLFEYDATFLITSDPAPDTASA